MAASPAPRPMTRCDRCGCYSPAALGYCRWCKPAEQAAADDVIEPGDPRGYQPEYGPQA